MISRSPEAQNLFFLLGSREVGAMKRSSAGTLLVDVWGQLCALCCAVTSATVHLFPYVQQNPFLIYAGTHFLQP